MESLNVMGIGELRQLEILLSGVLRDEALIEGLSLLEKQALEGTCAVVQSIIEAQSLRRPAFGAANRENR